MPRRDDLWRQDNKFCAELVRQDNAYRKEHPELTEQDGESIRRIYEHCPSYKEPVGRLMTLRESVEHVLHSECEYCRKSFFPVFRQPVAIFRESLKGQQPNPEV